MKVVFYIDRDTDIFDIEKLSAYKLLISMKKNYASIWNQKIATLEKINRTNSNLFGSDFYFFYGLARIAINYCRNVNYGNVRNGFCFRRFDKVKKISELYNPMNIHIAPIINNYAEYIKYNYFYNGIFYFDIYYDIEKFSFDELVLLIGKLLFPSYYFDIYENSGNIKNDEVVINRINQYLKNVKLVIGEIKKRHNNMPIISWITNLPL